MTYYGDLSENSVNVADIFAAITDDKIPGAVLVDARAVLQYVSMIAQEIVMLAHEEPENVDHYAAQAQPVLLIGDALGKYVALRGADVPDTLDGIEGVG